MSKCNLCNKSIGKRCGFFCKIGRAIKTIGSAAGFPWSLVGDLAGGLLGAGGSDDGGGGNTGGGSPPTVLTYEDPPWEYARQQNKNRSIPKIN